MQKATVKHHWKEAGVVLAALCIGLFLTFRVTLVSGLDVIPGDLGDARLVHYILEANVKNIVGLQNVWDLPFFYPARGVLAYSDTYLLPTVPYAIIRLIVGPMKAFPLWLMALSVLNFGAMYVVARKYLRVQIGWALFASFAFTFPLVQVVQLNHPQSLLRMGVPFALYVLYQFLRLRKIRYLIYVGLCIMLSLYAAVYVAFFLGLFTGAVLLLWGTYELVIKRREKTEHFLDISLSKTDIAAFFLVIVGTAYIGFQYMTNAPVQGGNENITFALSPTVADRVAYPQGSLVASALPVLSAIAVDNNDVSVGMGMVFLSLAAAAGVYAVRMKRTEGVLFFITAVLLCVIATKYGNVFVWSLLSQFVPGMYIIRATGRIWMVAYPALVVVMLLLWGEKRVSPMLLAGLLGLFVLDNAVITTKTFRMSDSERRIKAIQGETDASCTIVALEGSDYIVDGKIESLYNHIDAMHATLRTGTKLIGGYTGYRPAHYPVVINEATSKPLVQEKDTLCVVH